MAHTIYRGTQRNTIELLNVQTVYRYLLLQHAKRGNRTPAGAGVSSPYVNVGAFKPNMVITTVEQVLRSVVVGY